MRKLHFEIMTYFIQFWYYNAHLAWTSKSQYVSLLKFKQTLIGSEINDNNNKTHITDGSNFMANPVRVQPDRSELCPDHIGLDLGNALVAAHVERIVANQIGFTLLPLPSRQHEYSGLDFGVLAWFGSAFIVVRQGCFLDTLQTIGHGDDGRPIVGAVL